MFKTEKTIEIQFVRPTELCSKVKVRKMAKSLLKHHCYCPMLLMWTTKTAICLQTKAIKYFVIIVVGLIGVLTKYYQ